MVNGCVLLSWSSACRSLLPYEVTSVQTTFLHWSLSAKLG